MGPKSDNGYRPSRLGNFWFGKFYYWKDYPAHSFAVDQIALEAKIPPVDPAILNMKQDGLSRLRAKLQRKDSVTVVTMGDSLTDERHWANRETLWAKLLVESLKSKNGSEVTLVNPAIGGTTLSQNVVLIPRWSASSPDLVTIWFGGNDWDTGVRGERFAQYLRLAIDRVRAATGGKADILVMTTNPTHDRWDTYKELEEAARAVAKEKGVAVADVAGALRMAGKTPDEALKAELWAWDTVHLGKRGHQLARDVIIAAIESAK
jgi:lysophospholipase L1-like esterase